MMQFEYRYMCVGVTYSERLKAKTEGSKHLAYTGLRGGRFSCVVFSPKETHFSAEAGEACQHFFLGKESA